MKKFPVIFVGHGYPVNAVTDNPARRGWQKLGAELTAEFGKPRVIIALTGHWQTDAFCVRASLDNPCLMDIWDLPELEQKISYAPPSSAEFIEKVTALTGAFADNTWGVGHSIWAPLMNIYPECDVPVVVMSTNVEGSAEDAYLLGQQLAPLREEGALIFASGNIVHEVDMVDHSMSGGYPWAYEFDAVIKRLVLGHSLDELFDYRNIEHAPLAAPTPDHIYPLFSAMGAAGGGDVTVFNDFVERGSLSMASFIFQ